MTKIKRLYMKGFKSFANKTEIPFNDNFNCVLGPNGSGKSNLIDALCFVLGKAGAKGLRAEKSANLIYNGGKKKTPAKTAEVGIVFDNTSKIFGDEFEELTVSRTIKPSGQSVYRINQEVRTRAQILDLLSRARINPDGYNIVLQGDIVKLVEMSPIQRREIVEEIAGISVYEEKKNKAMRELGRVEEKLNEAHIVLIERKTYLKELKKERDQAARFKELDLMIKRNKATLIQKRIDIRQDKRGKLDKDIQGLNTKIEGAQSEIGKLKSTVEEKKEAIEEINKEVERKGEKDQVAIHKMVERLRVDIALNEQRIQTIEQELIKLKERKAELASTMKEAESKVANTLSRKKQQEQEILRKEKELQALEKKVLEFKKKNQLDDAHELDKQIETIDQEAEKFQEEIQELREKQQNLFREKDKLEVILSNIDEKISRMANVKKELKGQFEQLKKNKDEFKKATSELNTCLTNDSQFAAQLQTAQSKLLSRKEELAKLSARNISLRESLAGQTAVTKVLELKNKVKGIHGLVSELGSVSSDYALGLEVAAGNRIKSIVVDNDSTAAHCIRFLKEKKLGVATFLPMNKLNPPPAKPELKSIKANGLIGLAVNQITYDKKFQKVFQYVFGNTLLVNDIDVSRRLGIGKYRMVTTSGDLVELSGAMQGGHRQRQRGLGFQEKELSAQIEKLNAEVSDQEVISSALEAKREDNRAMIERLRNFKSELEGEIIKLEKILHVDSSEIDLSSREKKKIQSELKQFEKETTQVSDILGEKNQAIAQLKIRKHKLREQMSQLRNPLLLAELNSFEEKKTEIQRELTETRISLKNADNEITAIFGPEKENIVRILKQHEKEEEAFLKEQEEVLSLIKNLKADLAEKEVAEKRFYEQFKGLFNQRTKLSDEVKNLEQNTEQKTQTMHNIEIRLNGVSLEMAKTKAELAGLEEEINQFKGIEIYKDKPEEKIKKEISEFERMATDLGAVNLRALEIYDTVEQEYTKLLDKKDVLDKEREDILVMINEIDSKKRELFSETFQQLNEKFSTIFKNLSTKGDAFLNLEDKNDPFNGGVEIKVRLTGKRFLDIRSLSGGEKTLTALSFIFSVQEFDPASFYVLDEVDAALDKANSELLSTLISKYADRAQYILISHNDGVISSADTLYGVSMDEFGSSKITSLKI